MQKTAMNALSTSVVIPAFNSARYIGAALESIYRQTSLPVEVVVVDDASSDDTVVLVRRLASVAPLPVRLVRRSCNSGGPSSGLNVGADTAVGELIATLDHDDEMLPGKLEAQVSCLERWPKAALCIGRCVSSPEGGSRHAGVARANAFLAQLPAKETDGHWRLIDRQAAYESFAVNACYALTCSNMVFRKSAWKEVGGFDEKNVTGPDLDMLGKLTSRYDLAVVDADLVRWTAPAKSHYEAASALRLLEDMLRVYRQTDRGILPADILRQYDQRVATEALDTAYALREAGAYGKSADLYWRSLNLPTARRRAAAGLAKLMPHCALRRFRPTTKRSGRRLLDTDAG